MPESAGVDPSRVWHGEIEQTMDMGILDDGRQAFAEIGHDNLNWPAIVDATRQSQVSWIVVEQDACLRDPFESLAMSYRYLSHFDLS